MSLSRLLQLQEYISDKWTQKICGIEKWKIWNIFCWQLLSWKSKHTDRTTLMHPTARSRSACLCCRLTNIAVNALMSATLRKRWCEDLAVGSHLKFQLRWCDVHETNCNYRKILKFHWRWSLSDAGRGFIMRPLNILSIAIMSHDWNPFQG